MKELIDQAKRMTKDVESYNRDLLSAEKIIHEQLNGAGDSLSSSQKGFILEALKSAKEGDIDIEGIKNKLKEFNNAN